MPTAHASVSDALRSAFIQVSNDAEQSLESAAQIVPSRLKMNLDSIGARLGSMWPKVPVSWLSRRQTWPGDGMAKGRGLTAAQKAYISRHVPLRDTDKLYNSFFDERGRMQGRDYVVEVRPKVAYAAQHVLGRPDAGGPKQLHKRDFMQLNEQDRSDVVNAWGVAMRSLDRG